MTERSDAARAKALLSHPSMSAHDKAVFLACQFDSGAFLDLIPCGWRGFHFSSSAFRAICLFRLGKPLYTNPVPCPCCSTGFLDIYGHHAAYCSGEHDLSARHNAVREVLHARCSKAQLYVGRETPHLLPAHGAARPADILLGAFGPFHRDVCVDVTIADSLSHFTSPDPFEASTVFYSVEHAKNTRYLQACDAQGLDFQPFVMGSLGGYNAGAVSLIKHIGTALSKVTTDDASTCIDRLRKELAFTVQKCQANAWLRRGSMAGVMVY